MTSDGFVAFWRSVQNSSNFKSNYFGPSFGAELGPERNCAVYVQFFLV